MKFCPKCASALEVRKTDDRERLACPDAECGYIYYDNPTPVVAAIVQHGDDVILVRNHGWPETWYGLVTGFLERDETPEEGVLREVKEELDLDASVESFVGVYTFAMRNELIVAYHVAAEGEITLGDELADFKRVPVDKLKPWGFGTGEAVRDWLANR